MKIRIQITLAVLSLAIAATSSRAASIVWTNIAGGNWSDTNSWNPNQIPGGGDVAVITNDGTYSVALDVNPTIGGLMLGTAGGANIQSLSVSGGQTFTLNGAAQVSTNGQFNLAGGVLGGSIVLSGALNCSGGTLSGGLTVDSNSVLYVSASGMTLNSFTPGSSVLTNYGTVSWTGGDISCNYSPQIYNYGLWNAQSDNNFAGQINGGAGNGVFNNLGTFRKSGGSGTTTVDADAIFIGTGTVDVESGTVAIQKGQESGAANIASGTFLTVDNNTIFGGSTLFSGAGMLQGLVVGSNAVFSGTLNCSGVTLTGAITVASNAVVNLGTLAVSFNNGYASTGILTNYGTVNWSSDLTCDGSPQIYNYGLWDAQTDNTFAGQMNSGSGNGVFNNYGTFRKSAGTGISTFDSDAIFNNTGTVDVESATVAIMRGQENGAVNVAGGATLNFGNSVVFSGGTLFSGAGNVGGLLAGNNALFSGAVNCYGATFTGAITIASNAVVNLETLNTTFTAYLAGTGILTNYGTVNWGGGDFDCDNAPVIYNYGLWNAQSDNVFSGTTSSGITMFNNFGIFRKSGGVGITTVDFNTIFTSIGTIDVENGTVIITRGQASGAVNIAGGATLSPGNNVVFTGSTLFSGTGALAGLLNGNNAVFSGTILCYGTTLSGTMTIVTNGTLNLGNLNMSLSSLALTNYGTANWTGGDLDCNNSPQIYNYGLWNAQSDNTFVGEINGGSGNGVFNNYGTFRKSAGTGITSFDSDASFSSSTTVDVQSGTVSVYRGQINGGVNTAASTALSLGHLVVFGGTIFSGAGNVAGYVNGSNALFSGTLNCSGVALSGAITVVSNAVVNLGTLAVTFNNGYNSTALLTNYGTINWSSDLNCDGGPQIYNYGLWNAQTDNTLYGQQNFGSTTFNNYGIFRKSTGSGISTLDNSTVFTSIGTIDVENGTVIITRGQASGAVNIAGGATLSPGNNVVFTGSTLFSGTGALAGLLNGNNAVFSGTILCYGTTLSGTMTIVTNGTLNLGNLNMSLSSLALTNYGTANWTGGDLDCNNSPQIYNYGLWNAQSDNTFVGEINGGSGNGVFNNYGTFRKSAGTGITSFDSDASFSSSTTVDVQSGTVSVYRGQINGGVNTAASTALSLGHLVVFGGTIFSGAGNVAGYVNGSNALFSGTLNCSGVALSGAITVVSNAVVNLGTLAVTFNNGYNSTALLTNYGTINWSSDLNCDGGPQIYNYGLWNAQTDNTLYGQQNFGSTTFNNYGIFRKSTGSGITSLNGFTIFNNPGIVDVQSGTVSILGTRTLTGGSLNFGINSANNFGHITMAGAVTLTGTVSVNLNNAYTPTNGVSFALLTYGSESGAFTNFNLPVLQGLFWTNNYGATAFSLTATSIVPPVVASSSISHSGGNFSFNWGAVSGQAYQVQYTTNLVPANWINLGGPVTATNATMSVSDAIGTNSQRFYRVVLP